MKLKVLVVDDTIVYRKIVSDILNEFPETEVVGTANNGQIALSRIKSLKPDLVTLDVEMPVMDGLQALQEIKSQKLDVGVIMVSTLTKRGSDITMQALQMGAFDFVAKPEESEREKSIQALRTALHPKIRAFLKRLDVRRALKKGKSVTQEGKDVPVPAAGSEVKHRDRDQTRTEKSDIVAIGISTGGPNTLTEMLPQFPKDMPVPVVIVQHMPALFTKSLADSLNTRCSLEVREAKEGEEVLPRTIYIAPGGKQMKVATGAAGKKIIRVTDDPPENNCKPAVDYLFRSVAREYKSKTTAVVMTGMGNDGTLGLRVVKSFGGLGIAQNAETCVVYGMPKTAIEAGVVDIVAPLDKMAQEIIKTVK